MPVPSALSRLFASVAIFSALLLLTGCNETAVTNAILPQAERLRLTNEFINQAIDNFNKGRQADGDAALNRAVVLMTPAPSEGYDNIGFIEVAKQVAARGRPQDAVRLLEPLSKSSKDPLLWATLADAAKRGGNTKLADSAARTAQASAEATLKTAGAPEPRQSEALKRAQDFTRVGQYFDEFSTNYARAVAAYREAYRLVPSEPMYANNLGYVLANRGTTPAEYDEAVKLTRAALEKAPDHPVVLDSFGWALFKRNNSQEKDLDGAQRRLREAVDLAPSLAEVHYHLAVVYAARQMYPSALVEAERAVLLAADNKEMEALRDEVKQKVATMPAPSPSPSAAASASPAPTASPAQK